MHSRHRMTLTASRLAVSVTVVTAGVGIVAALSQSALAAPALTSPAAASPSLESPTVSPLGGTSASPLARPAHGPALTAPAVRGRQEANEIVADAIRLRRDVAATLAEYEQAYGPDLSASDRSRLSGYVRTADLQLAAVVRDTTRLRSVVRRSSSSTSQVSAAKARAQAAWAQAQGTSEASFASARRILEPRMSLFAKASALVDYTTLMTRFEDLGEQIDTLGVS